MTVPGAHAIAACCSAALLACGSDPGPLTSVSFRALGLPALEDGRCPGDVALPAPDFPGGAADLARLTFSTAEGALLCDAVVSVAAPPVVAIPEPDGGLDLTIEYFRDPGQPILVGAGTTRGAALAEGALIDVVVTPSGAHACADVVAEPRAFHSATALPDGRVLLVGGVTLTDPASGALYASPGATIYDPVARQIVPLAIDGLIPRAFHRAALVPRADGEPFTVLVTGGVTVAQNPAITPVGLAGAAPFTVAPAATAQPAPSELLAIDPQTLTTTRTPVAADMDVAATLWPAAADGPLGSDAPMVLAGGLLPADRAPRAAVVLQNAEGTRRATLDTLIPRWGATIIRLTDGSAVVWGGNVASPAGTASADSGELVVGLDAAGTPAVAPLPPSGQGPPVEPRAMHAAALAADGAIVVFGGFRAAPAPDGTMAARTAARIAVAGSTVARAIEREGGGTAIPVAYPLALPLPGGEILLSGGNPAGTCPESLAGAGCALADAYRYDDARLTLEPTGALAVARYGHAATPLPDGTVLVTGGLGVGDAGLTVIGDVEIFDPRGTGAAIAPLPADTTRAPGDVARDADGEPLRPCTLIER